MQYCFNLFWSILCLLLFTFASCQDNTRVQYYVSPTGDDTHSGSETAPFLTLSKAKKAVQNQTTTAPVEIIIKEGIYYLKEPLVFTSGLSGTVETPFVLRAEEGKDVILSGGVPLKLSWEKEGNNLWKAAVQEVDSIPALYTPERQLIPARYPNYEEDVYPYGGYAEDALSSERIARWKNPSGGYIHAMHQSRWGGMHYKIIGKDEENALIYKGGWQNNRPSKMHSSQRYVEHIFEELDAPGEWYFDQEKNTLFYYPYEGEDPNKMTFIAGQLKSLIELKGTSDAPVRNFKIEGISFKHTVPTFMQTKEPLLRSDWRIYRGGAVKLEGTKNFTIQNSNFQHLGGNALFVDGFNRNTVISGNLIEDIGASAIAVIGKPEAVRSPSFQYGEFIPASDIDTIPGPKTNEYPAEGLIEDNLIRRIGRIEKQVAGIEIQIASAITARHNTIYKVPRAGINIGDGAWGGHVLELNDVFETVLETGDHGAFNAWGRDRFWHPNRSIMDSIVSVHPEWVLLDAQQPTIIRNNRFRCDHGWDIDLDDGATNYEIYNNLALNGGIKLREGFYRKVYNNILLNNGFHPHVWFKNSGDVFRNNIVMTAHQPIGMEYWGEMVDYNIFMTKEDLDQVQQWEIDENSSWIDPEFKNPEEGDFTVTNKAISTQNFQPVDFSKVGVTSSRLKQLADTPSIPELLLSNKNKASSTVNWHDTQIKTVETLGEQSATGLAHIGGVLILSLEENSALKKGGFQPNDVILNCFGQEIKDILTLKKVEAANKWRGRMSCIIWRDQKEKSMDFHL